MILKSINYWSMPGGLEGNLAVSTFLHAAKRHGYDAVELCIGESGALGLDSSESKCKAIVDEAHSLGLSIPSTASGLYWSRALGDASASARSQAVEDLQKMVQISGWLGAKTHLTIPGAVEVFFLPEREIVDYAHVWEHATEGLKQVIPYAEAAGVRMGLENVWNKFLMSPIEMRTFIDQFDSPFIGSYLDVANILPFGYPEQWLRILGKRIVGIHFKDFRKAVGTIEGFVDLLEGDVNWPELMKAIGEIGYSGPVVGEMIPYYKTNPDVRLANTSRAMDAILGRN
ncbi:MAG: sugar phosphate isomerase/epimerase [Fimbriimonas sp.]|nr:sugar phosphate isomerase/epimerase [Fimbriimonas sp.]